MNWIYEYIRLCCYALVVIISLFHIAQKRGRKYHIITDFIISSGLFLSVFGYLFSGLAKDPSRNFILTPVVMIWTAVIFYEFVKK